MKRYTTSRCTVAQSKLPAARGTADRCAHQNEANSTNAVRPRAGNGPFSDHGLFSAAEVLKQICLVKSRRRRCPTRKCILHKSSDNDHAVFRLDKLAM